MRRRRLLPGAMLLLVALSLLLGPAAATAQDTTQPPGGSDTGTDSGSEAPNAAFASLDIGLIGDVPWEEGRPVDARVAVKTQRAISGSLVVVDTPAGRATTTYEFTIDLAADSNVVFPVTLSTGWEGVQATATVRSNGEVIANNDVQRFGEQSGDIGAVGVLGIDSPPQRLAEAEGDNQLAVLVLDDQLQGVDRISSLITTPPAVRSLGDGSDELLRLEAWIRGGGQLVVDGPIASLADPYHRWPTANPARFDFGAGSILYDEQWRDGIPLGGYLGVGGMRELVESQELGAGAAGELAILANVALPGVVLIAGVLFLYSLVAGPVVFGFLTAKRAQRRIWSVLPLLSLLFASGILAVGFVGRSGRTEAHISIVEVNERGSRATSNLLLNSSFGGNRRIETPPGWTYRGQGRTSGSRPVQLRVGSSSTEISIDMPPGSNAVARLSGPSAEFDGVMSIDNTTLDGDQVTGEVFNHGTTDLTDAVAFLGNARTEIGVVPAGGSVAFSIDAVDTSGRTMKELLIWPRVGREWGNSGPVAVPRDRDARTAAGAWTEWRIEQGTTASPEDVLGVVAWSDQLASPVPGIDEGRTALFVRSDVSGLRQEIDFRTTSRLPSHQQPVFDGNFAGFVEDYRVTLGEAADLDRLAIAVTSNSAALALFTEEGWRFVDLPESGDAQFAIPPEAVIDGEIMVRSYVPEWVWGAGATAFVAVDADQPPPVRLRAAAQFRNAEGIGNVERQGQPGFGPVPGPGGEAPRGLQQESSTALTDVVTNEEFVTTGEISANSHHAFVVTLAQDQSLVVTMHSNQGDSYLELLDGGGQLLASNDDFGRGVDSQIRYVATAAGDYEIRAMDLGSGQIAYQLTVEVSE